MVDTMPDMSSEMLTKELDYYRLPNDLHRKQFDATRRSQSQAIVVGALDEILRRNLMMWPLGVFFRMYAQAITM